MPDMPFLADLAASRTEPSFECSRTEGRRMSSVSSR